MTDTPAPVTPRTEAGRTTLRVVREVFAAIEEVARAYEVPISVAPDDPLPLILAIEREAAAPAHKHDPDACADCFDMITEEMTVSD